MTHDYTKPAWGHDYTFQPIDGGLRGWLIGWGTGIEKGHYILLRNGSGSSRYRIKSIRYDRDPPDMWAAEAVFAPRTHDDT